MHICTGDFLQYKNNAWTFEYVFPYGLVVAHGGFISFHLPVTILHDCVFRLDVSFDITHVSARHFVAPLLRPCANKTKSLQQCQRHCELHLGTAGALELNAKVGILTCSHQQCQHAGIHKQVSRYDAHHLSFACQHADNQHKTVAKCTAEGMEIVEVCGHNLLDKLIMI